MRRYIHILLVLLACVSCRYSSSAPGLHEGDMFVDFSLSSGRSFLDYAGRGNYVLVYGWASWSEPSVAQLRRLEEVSADVVSANVIPLALAICDTPSSAAPLAAGYAPSVPLAVCESSDPSVLFGEERLPFLMLFGPDGTLLKKNLRWRDLPKTLRYTVGN
jgi:hypothetical protein